MICFTSIRVLSAAMLIAVTSQTALAQARQRRHQRRRR